MKTFCIIDWKEIEVTEQNKNSFVWVSFYQRELTEKEEYIEILKDLWKQGEDMRSKYLSTELLPESETKTEKLRILHERWQEVMTKYLTKETEAIAKYWVEILQEIL